MHASWPLPLSTMIDIEKLQTERARLSRVALESFAAKTDPDTAITIAGVLDDTERRLLARRHQDAAIVAALECDVFVADVEQLLAEPKLKIDRALFTSSKSKT